MDYDEVGLFFGILFCADWGSVMYQQRYQTDKRRQDCYICGSYKKRTRDCTAHFIRIDLLTEGVTENLLEGKRFEAGASRDEMEAWLENKLGGSSHER